MNKNKKLEQLEQLVSDVILEVNIQRREEGILEPLYIGKSKKIKKRDMVNPFEKVRGYSRVSDVSLRHYIDGTSEYTLSKPSKLVLLFFMVHVKFGENCIAVDNQILSAQELSKRCDVNINAFYDALNELEKIEIIKRVKIPSGMGIYVNPYLFNHGKVYSSTMLYFKDSIYKN